MSGNDSNAGAPAALPTTEPENVYDTQQVDAFVGPIDASPVANGVSEATRPPTNEPGALTGGQQRDAEMLSKDKEPAGELSDVNNEPSVVGDEVDESNEETKRDAHDLARIPKARSKSRAEREAAKGKKAGNQGRFRGEVLVWMEGMYNEYLKIDKRKGSRGKNKRLGDFWYNVRVGLWGAFTWKDLDVYGENDEDIVVAAVNNAIPGWFQWRDSHAHTTEKNPWKEVLGALRKPTGSAPKKLPAHMLYASENAAAVTAACSGKANIGERNKMAKALYEAEEEDVQERYKEAARKRHETELANHNEALSGLPSTDPEERSKARDRLAEVVTPLLNLISEYTGFTCVTLIGGMAQGDSWMCKSVNIGKTNDIVPQRFDEWDAPGFRKNFCGQFVRFVKECTKDAMADGTDAPSDSRTAPDISGAAGNTTTSHPIAVPTNIPSFSIPSDPSTNPDDGSLPGGVDAEHEDERPFSTPPSPSPSPASSDEDECPEGVRAALRGKVYALTGAERRAEIRRLRNLEEIELDRENNVAERQEIFADLGLDTMFKKPAKAKRPSEPRPVLSGSSSNNEDAAVGGEDSISRCTRSFTSGAHPDSDTFASPTPAASASSISTATVSAPCTNGAPAWIKKQYSVLAAEDLPTAHRQLWLSTLKTWWDLEQARGFEETKPGLPTTHRPADIALWIQNARKYRIIPKNKNAYLPQWWKWWKAVNPSWRVIEGDKPLSGGTGDWSPLFKSGRNGFLTVLASLVGLHNAADETEWLTALIDVNWVLGEVLSAQRTAGTKRARASDDEDENDAPDDVEPQTKRRKRKTA